MYVFMTKHVMDLEYIKIKTKKEGEFSVLIRYKILFIVIIILSFYKKNELSCFFG